MIDEVFNEVNNFFIKYFDGIILKTKKSMDENEDVEM